MLPHTHIPKETVLPTPATGKKKNSSQQRSLERGYVTPSTRLREVGPAMSLMRGTGPIESCYICALCGGIQFLGPPMKRSMNERLIREESARTDEQVAAGLAARTQTSARAPDWFSPERNIQFNAGFFLPLVLLSAGHPRKSE